MDGFGFDDFEDLIEADIQFGLFEDDDKQLNMQKQDISQIKKYIILSRQFHGCQPTKSGL